MEDKMKRMRELVELLNRARRAYEQEDKEIMSNYEYDRLYDELQGLEQELNTTLASSPTVQVGYEVLSELPKERQTIMFSIRMPYLPSRYRPGSLEVIMPSSRTALLPGTIR